MQIIGLTQVKMNCYNLIDKVLKKEAVVITKYGKPVAKLEDYRNKS